ncbi:FAD/NAD(P)-binding protein [Methylocystis sp. Sn-Cys]|uniref:FAD/NAD(P)-binding protein n=1 Tax=Methylocystis sp. Sn-Cys TaxID=1701263 RepID=UPI001FEF4C9E|nr:FAD/NAD(P)-binding protein [Methylocystis sp. Sn-Cys]
MMSETAALLHARPMVPQIAHVRRRRHDAPDAWTLELEMASGERFHYAPGQFNMLTAFGVGEAAISVSGDPADGPLIHTIRAVGPVSKALTQLGPGDPIGVRGPFGVGWPMAQAEGRDVVVVAGGLGLAPLRPALYSLLGARDRFGKVTLLFGARRPEEIVFRREVEHWRGRLDMDVEVTVDHATGGWHGNVGVVTNLLSRLGVDPAKTLAMVCGPEVMMRFVSMALVDKGVGEEAIYLSMERNMKCAIGQCGHCQLGPTFICRDGPVFTYARLKPLLAIKEL